MPAVAYLHLAIVYVVWGTAYPVVRFVLIDTDAPTPIQLQSARLLISSAVLALPLMWRARFFVIERRDLMLCLASGFLFWVTGNGFSTLAMRELPAGFVAMAAAGVPLWTALLQSVFYQRKVAPVQLALVGVGLLGMSLVFWPALTSVANDELYKPLELLMAFLAPISWALGSLLQRPLQGKMSPEVAASIQMASGGICWLIAAMIDGSQIPSRFNPMEIVAFLYLVFFVGALCFSSYVKVTRLLPAHIGATFAYVNPVIGLLLSWLFLGEKVVPLSLVGMTIIIGSVVVLIWDARQSGNANN